MKVISKIRQFKLNNSAVTLGKFDGLHMGHMSLVNEVVNARRLGLVPVLFTFDISPYELVGGNSVKYILDDYEKYRICEQAGIEVVIEYPFDEHTMAMDADAFVKNVLIDQIDAKEVVVGNDFSFGKDRSGTTETLKKYRDYFNLIIKDKVLMQKSEISSTLIRDMIINGEIEKANEMLGHPLSFRSMIVRGKQIGRTIGMPTVNITVGDERLLPPLGVYASEVVIGNKKYKGITNIGINPTVSSDTDIKVETHLLECNEDLYGEMAQIKILKFIRREKKFDSLEQLKAQIESDINIVKNMKSIS